MIHSANQSVAPTVAPSERRRSIRLSGPFDGVRIGILDLPVRIYDLSAGGCFVNAKHDQHPGVSFELRLQLPGEGWLKVQAETLYRRPEYGYAVRFVAIDPDTSARLEAALGRLSDDRLP